MWYENSGKWKLDWRKALEQLAIDHEGIITLDAGGPCAVPLRVVSWYKHMGGIITADGNTSLEIAARTRASYEAHARIRTILKRQNLSNEAKLMASSSLCHSRLFHNIHIVGKIKSVDWRKLSKAFHMPLRVATNMAKIDGNPTTLIPR